MLINNNSCHTATKLAVVPDLRGVLQPPEPPAGHAPVIPNKNNTETVVCSGMCVCMRVEKNCSNASMCITGVVHEHENEGRIQLGSEVELTDYTP